MQARSSVASVCVVGTWLLTGAVFAQNTDQRPEEDRPVRTNWAASLAVGPSWSVVPLSDTGLSSPLSSIEDEDTIRLHGPSVAGAVSRHLWALGSGDLYLEAAGRFTHGDATRNRRLAASPIGAFAFTAGSLAGDSVQLNTNTGATTVDAIARVTLTAPSGATATIDQTTLSPLGPNGTNNFAQSPARGGGVAFTNVVTDGDRAAATAIGFVGDADGFGFGATGALSEIDVQQFVDDERRSGLGEIRLIAALPWGGKGWIATPSIAPAFYASRRSTRSRLDVLLPAIVPNGPRPAVVLDRRDELDTEGWGAVAGMGLFGPVGADTLSFGADLGVIDLRSHYSGRSEVTVFGTERVDLPSAPERLSSRSTAILARANVDWVRRAGRISITAGLSGEYMSATPFVRRTANATGPNVVGSALVLDAASAASPSRIRYGSSVSFGARLGISMSF